MTIGQELDEQFIKIAQRLASLEDGQNELVDQIVRVGARSNVDDLADKETVLGTEADLTSQVERLEAELNDRIDELENDMGFDPDDLRCDLESQIEDLRDNISYNDDRIDDLECYKITEDEARDIALDVVRDEIDSVNDNAIGFTEWTMLVDRVKELEDRLNKPSLSGRIVRWLREGPSIKETATSWYAGIRRGS